VQHQVQHLLKEKIALKENIILYKYRNYNKKYIKKIKNYLASIIASVALGNVLQQLNPFEW
jgi:hypothetical protein